MSTGTTKAPSIPNAPEEYDRMYFDKTFNILRLYFVLLDTPGQSAASQLNLNIKTLPTQADLATLRSGDVYRDTTANNVLKVKP